MHGQPKRKHEDAAAHTNGSADIENLVQLGRVIPEICLWRDILRQASQYSPSLARGWSNTKNYYYNYIRLTASFARQRGKAVPERQNQSWFK